MDQFYNNETNEGHNGAKSPEAAIVLLLRKIQLVQFADHVKSHAREIADLEQTLESVKATLKDTGYDREASAIDLSLIHI